MSRCPTTSRPRVPRSRAALAWATIEAGRRGFDAPSTLAGYAVAALALGTFVAIERRAEDPMLPLALFGRRRFGAAALTGLLVNVCFYGLLFALSLYFGRAQGLSALHTGLAFLPMTAAIMGANLLAPRLDARIGPARVMLAGEGAMAGACVALLVSASSTSYLALLAPLVCLGAGLGLVVPPMTALLLGSVERARSGIAAGTLTAMRQTGSVLGVAGFGSLLARGIVGGLHASLVVSTGLLGAAALSALPLLPRRAP